MDRLSSRLESRGFSFVEIDAFWFLNAAETIELVCYFFQREFESVSEMSLWHILEIIIVLFYRKLNLTNLRAKYEPKKLILILQYPESALF